MSTVYEKTMQGLEEALAHEKGCGTAVTRTLCYDELTHEVEEQGGANYLRQAKISCHNVIGMIWVALWNIRAILAV